MCHLCGHECFDTGSRANGRLCEVDDLDSLAATLRQALVNATERKRRGASALALIRGEYDWKEIARRYAEVYKHILGLPSQKMQC